MVAISRKINRQEPQLSEASFTAGNFSKPLAKLKIAVEQGNSELSNESMTELYKSYAPHLANLLNRKFAIKHHAAEDIIQQVMLKLFLKASLFDIGKQEWSYIKTIAERTAIDYLRRNKNHNNTLKDSELSPKGSRAFEFMVKGKDGEDPQKAAMNDEMREKSKRLSQSIVDFLRSQLKREPAVLLVAGGMKYREAAGVFGIPLGTIKSRIHHEIISARREFESCFRQFFK